MASDAQNTAAATLFLVASTTTMDAFSALMSSPWTVENFGGDEEKMASAREYVLWSIGQSAVLTGGAAIIGRSPWPIIGMAVEGAFMWWFYDRARRRGQASGSSGWAKS